MGEVLTKQRIKVVLPLMAILIIAGAIILFIKNMNGPAQGAVSNQPLGKVAIKPTQSTSHKYDGQYISFNYPANYTIVTSQKSAGTAEIVSLNNTDHSGKYISISVLQHDTLTNDSGVNYRKGHPELYKQLSSTANGIVFAGTQQAAEQTGFLAHNGLVASISFTAIGNKDLSKDYDLVANSLQWKQ